MALTATGKLGDILASLSNLLQNTDELKSSPKNSASIVVLATISGQYSLAATHLNNAMSDGILGAIALRFYHYYTRDWKNVKPAIKTLINRFKNMSSELVVTRDPERQEIAYGIYGSPLRFEEGTMYSIDATVFKLIALETIADIMSTKDYEVSAKYRDAYNALKKRTQQHLYNEELGIYMNRHVQGDFSLMYGIGSMLAPLAGLTDTQEQLENIILSLKSPSRFNAYTGVPTIPKNNYYFGRSFVNWNGQQVEEYRSGSGMVSPVFNFLVYMGLKRYGVDQLATELAQKSYRAFLEEEKLGNYPSYYMPDWRQSTSPKHHSIRAGFMAVLPFLQAFSYDIFGRGLNISSIDADGTIEQCVFSNGSGRIVLTEEKTAIEYEGIERLSISQRASIAYYVEDDSIAFSVFTTKDSTLKLSYPLFAKTSTLTLEEQLTQGKSYVNIDVATGAPLVVKFNS